MPEEILQTEINNEILTTDEITPINEDISKPEEMITELNIKNNMEVPQMTQTPKPEFKKLNNNLPDWSLEPPIEINRGTL